MTKRPVFEEGGEEEEEKKKKRELVDFIFWCFFQFIQKELAEGIRMGILTPWMELREN